MKMKYIRTFGYPLLDFDIILVAKRLHTIKGIKNDLKQKKFSIDKTRFDFSFNREIREKWGDQHLRGNENNISDLYRRRLQIEIAFRGMSRLGISNKSQNRNVWIGIMGITCLLYNIWQVQSLIIETTDLIAPAFELDEFMGKCVSRQYPQYFAC